MPRLARKDLNTPFLHVMVQGVNKEYLFQKKQYIETYLDIINRNKEKYNFTIIAYCIMHNHAHFLIYTPDINNFGKFMHKTNLIYAQMYNEKENRCGVLFRNRYQTEPIYDIRYLVNCIKYIHNNPVKAKIVSKCEDYKYSSYNDYMKNEGATQSKIMQEIFGIECDYETLFKETYERKFMDIGTEGSDEYILEGMKEFKKQNSLNTIDILSNRKKLKELIKFLNRNCGLKYIEIRNFFEIPRGAMDALKEEKF